MDGPKVPVDVRVVNVKAGDAYDVFIGRPSKWGNPFRIGRDGNREAVIAKFRAFMESSPEAQLEAREELCGKVLGCFCAPLPCHGDILAEYASSEPSAQPKDPA